MTADQTAGRLPNLQSRRHESNSRKVMNRLTKQQRKERKREFLESPPSYREAKEQEQIKSISTEEITDAALAGDDLEWRIVQVVLNRIGDEWHREEEVLRELPDGPRAIFSTWTLESEVMNGGFEQFFSNQAPHVWECAVTDYESLGLPEWSAVAATALSKLLSGITDFDDEDDALIEAWDHIKRVKSDEIRSNPANYEIQSR